MKVITLYQPYASLMMGSFDGVGRGYRPPRKHIETRSWKINYLGEIAIHAGIGIGAELKNWIMKDEFMLNEIRLLGYQSLKEMPKGCILGYRKLVQMIPTETLSLVINPIEAKLGNYSRGRWGWVMSELPRRVNLFVTPIKVKGSQGLWNYPVEDDAQYSRLT